MLAGGADWAEGLSTTLSWCSGHIAAEDSAPHEADLLRFQNSGRIRSRPLPVCPG